MLYNSYGKLLIKVTLKSLLLVVRIEKFSKSRHVITEEKIFFNSNIIIQHKLQNETSDWRRKMFFNGNIIITFNCFSSECLNFQVFTHSVLKIMFSFVVTSSTVAITLKFENNARTQGRWNFFLLVWKKTQILQYQKLFLIVQLIL